MSRSQTNPIPGFGGFTETADWAEQMTQEAVAERHAFLRHAYAALAPGEQALLSHKKYTRWNPRKQAYEEGFVPAQWTPDAPFNPVGEHYNCWAFRSGSTRALGENATRAHIIMLDDVGNIPGKSHCPLERVLLLPLVGQPHAMVVTRQSNKAFNCQAAWFVTPCSLNDARDLISSALRAGWGDPDTHASVRWARPPASIKFNDNSYVARLLRHNFAAPRISIDALAQILGLPGFRNERALRVASSLQHGARALPDADTVRSALSSIPNDAAVDRNLWFRLCMAVKASCGDLPALTDDEGFKVFDEWSRQHASYDEAKTTKAWDSAPVGRITFGTLAWQAKQRGWRVSAEQMQAFTEFDKKYRR